LDKCLWDNASAGCYSLEKSVTHVWCAELDLGGMELERLNVSLSDDEQTRAGRFLREQDRTRFIAARGQLRAILGRYLNQDPHKLVFSYNQYGKPALNKNPLCFNLSHSQGLALYALTLERDVGVDIEFIRPVKQMEAIVKRFFSQKEQEEFSSIPEADRKRAFFACWTRKEAFIKALGRGMWLSLDAFDVTVDSDADPKITSIRSEETAPTEWSVSTLYPALGYAASLVVEGTQKQVCCYRI